MTESKTKECEICGARKPVADFSKSYKYRCKACVAAEARMHRASQSTAVEKICSMKWHELNLTDALIGMHVLVKGYNRNTGKWFFAIGYIDKYGNQFALLREEDIERNYIENVRLFNSSLSYWYINIDEIEA